MKKAIAVYILSIVCANVTLYYQVFGPWTIYINSFLYIGMDFTVRDTFSRAWGHSIQGTAKIGGLILLGGLITFVGTYGATLSIVVGSVVAFVAANVADTIAYGVLPKHKGVGSNMIASVVDSWVFPLLAFGIVTPTRFVALVLAKFLGSLFWYRCLRVFNG